jgi:hypothetical protein
MAEMVTGAELLDGIVGELVRIVSVCCVATTLTVNVFFAVPDVAVSVIVDPAVAPSPERVAVTTPLEFVVVVAPDSVPALAASATVAPLTATLLEFFASTVIVVVVLPSAGIDVAVLEIDNEATPLPVGTGAAAVTVALPVKVPSVPVTVITVPAATPLAVSVVVAAPVELVVAVLDERVPAEVVKDTVAPEMPVPLELVTTAVIVTVVDPSSATVDALLLTATAAGVVLVLPPLVPVQVLVVLVVPLLPPFSAPQPLSPPQPAKASVNPNRAISAASLRMFLS